MFYSLDAEIKEESFADMIKKRLYNHVEDTGFIEIQTKDPNTHWERVGHLQLQVHPEQIIFDNLPCRNLLSPSLSKDPLLPAQSGPANSNSQDPLRSLYHKKTHSFKETSPENVFVLF